MDGRPQVAMQHELPSFLVVLLIFYLVLEAWNSTLVCLV